MENELRVSDLANDLIAYTVVNSPSYVPPTDNQYELDDMQKQYLQGLIDGKQPKDMCKELGLSRIQHYLWAKKCRLFAETVELIQKMQADDLESSMWKEALVEGSNPIPKMFLLKGFKDRYRDNAAPPAVNAVNIHVSVGGQEFKVVADATPNDED